MSHLYWLIYLLQPRIVSLMGYVLVVNQKYTKIVTIGLHFVKVRTNLQIKSIPLLPTPLCQPPTLPPTSPLQPPPLSPSFTLPPPPPFPYSALPHHHHLHAATLYSYNHQLPPLSNFAPPPPPPPLKLFPPQQQTSLPSNLLWFLLVFTFNIDIFFFFSFLLKSNENFIKKDSTRYTGGVLRRITNSSQTKMLNQI